jgi:hypothetical protein
MEEPCNRPNVAMQWVTTLLRIPALRSLCFRLKTAVTVWQLGVETTRRHIPEGYRLQYSVRLQTGRPGDGGSIPGRGKGCVHTSSEAHPSSYSMGTGCPFYGGKARPGRDADHSPHLVPRSRMNRSCTPSLLYKLQGERCERIYLNTSVFYKTIRYLLC